MGGVVATRIATVWDFELRRIHTFVHTYIPYIPRFIAYIHAHTVHVRKYVCMYLYV